MIREATVDDLKNCQELAEKFYHSRNTKGQFDGFYWGMYWLKLIHTGVGKILLREDSNGGIVEAIGYIEHPGNAGNPCVSTMFWFVIDDSQGLASGALLKAFVDGPASGKEARVALLIGSEIMKVASVVCGHGFEAYEKVYLKEGQCQ